MSDKTLPADFRVYVNLCRNKKTKRLMREMGDRAFYCIVSLWCYAAENSPDGNLGDMDADDLADASNWAGSTNEEWRKYLIQNGWLDERDGAVFIHDWMQMQPWASRDRQKRSEINRANALKRWNSDANRIATASNSQCKGDMQSQCPHSHTHTHTQAHKIEQYIPEAPVEPACEKVELKEPVKTEKQIDAEKAQERKKVELKKETDAVFTFWAEVMQKPGAKLSPKRKARIEWALKEYGQDRARKAIIGCASSAFHMGENENGKRFDDLELIFRNSGKFESFEALGEKARTYQDAVTGFTVVAVTPPEEKGWGRGQKEQPHPFFDNKGVEFASAKMMRRIAEEEAIKAAQDAARLQAIEEARYDS